MEEVASALAGLGAALRQAAFGADVFQQSAERPQARFWALSEPRQ